MKAQILKSEVRNNKVIVILKNDFNQMHVAMWNGTNVDALKNNGVPLFFKMTGSYGSDFNNTFLQAKFNHVVLTQFI